MQNTFITRLYSLDVVTFYKYSFLYFFILVLNKDYFKVLYNHNIKITFLYNNSLKKKNSVFILYTSTFYNLFSLCKMTSILNNSIPIKTSLSFNSILYSFKYYNNNIKKIFLNWTFFLKKIRLFYYRITILNVLFNNIYCFFYIFFLTYKNIFSCRYFLLSLL